MESEAVKVGNVATGRGCRREGREEVEAEWGLRAEEKGVYRGVVLCVV